MSFLSVIVCDAYISVMADSRGSEVYTDGRFHKVLSEQEDKIKNVTENVFFSITGILEDAEKFLANSDFLKSIIEDKGIKAKVELDKWLLKNAHYNYSDVSYTIYFGGLSVDNKFRVYAIENGSNKLEELVYLDGQLSYWLSPSSFWKDDFPQRMFVKLMESYDGSLQSIQAIQKILNDIIAESDPSVNKITKFFYLERVNQYDT